MKLTVTHDRNGYISSMVAYPDDAPPALLPTEVGEAIAFLDAPDLQSGLPHEEIVGYLDRLQKSYRVAVDGNARLVAR